MNGSYRMLAERIRTDRELRRARRELVHRAVYGDEDAMDAAFEALGKLEVALACLDVRLDRRFGPTLRRIHLKA